MEMLGIQDSGIRRPPDWVVCEGQCCDSIPVERQMSGNKVSALGFTRFVEVLSSISISLRTTSEWPGHQLDGRAS